MALRPSIEIVTGDNAVTVPVSIIEYYSVNLVRAEKGTANITVYIRNGDNQPLRQLYVEGPNVEDVSNALESIFVHRDAL